MIAVGVPGIQGAGAWGAVWVVVVLAALMVAYVVGVGRVVAARKRSLPTTRPKERVPEAA